ncbi:DUF932 domain-containing protein [[Clostridium] fimetarium]|uniref:Phage/plasmid-like protein TIGR03299 n=1 Tax=[Clostridium] fimetarium TaxID=99656 RepID=A0A1I0Q0K8_9FIRM|nr:DUF932 domain-containing protein [[Clostridium] fimetarium]SEW20283.1 phage/plasmid-like protein TIGR03299 [[Clostridium] fimetarium]
MSANVETMFYVREVPWHGLGTRVEKAPTSKDAIIMAGLNWEVKPRNIYTSDGTEVEGYKANIRTSDEKILGVVTDKYQIVQNEEAFAFTDNLLSEGITYETAGSLQGGKRTWILAKMPGNIKAADDEITPYMVFSNSFDGSSSIKVAMTPIRVVCQNTLNLALSTAKRSWACKHMGIIQSKMEEAGNTLLLADRYLQELKSSIEQISLKKISDGRFKEYMDTLFPISEDMTEMQKKNSRILREQLSIRYFDAPDLEGMDLNGYRFINAVSDFATHASPLRKGKNYRENLFFKTVEGNAMIDKAYAMIKVA